MDTFILGNAAFAYAFRMVQPEVIVDYLIERIVDFLVPPSGTFTGNSWFEGRFRAIERMPEKIQREADIRNEIRKWDNQFPELRHDYIVRTIAGLISSSVITSAYTSFCARIRGASRKSR